MYHNLTNAELIAKTENHDSYLCYTKLALELADRLALADAVDLSVKITDVHERIGELRDVIDNLSDEVESLAEAAGVDLD